MGKDLNTGADRHGLVHFGGRNSKGCTFPLDCGGGEECSQILHGECKKEKKKKEEAHQGAVGRAERCLGSTPQERS